MIIHDGNLIGLISYRNQRVEFNVNYGKANCYPCELKKIDDLFITVPVKEYLSDSQYQYRPLVFEEEAYNQLIDICYIDRALLENINQVSKQDIRNILVMHFKLESGMGEILEDKDIINNIIIDSTGKDNEVIGCIVNWLGCKSVNIKKVNESNLSDVTLYVDYFGKLYEWDSIVKCFGRYYFNLVDEYVIEI